jgi:hypothetical protein
MIGVGTATNRLAPKYEKTTAGTPNPKATLQSAPWKNIKVRAEAPKRWKTETKTTASLTGKTNAARGISIVLAPNPTIVPTASAKTANRRKTAKF